VALVIAVRFRRERELLLRERYRTDWDVVLVDLEPLLLEGALTLLDSLNAGLDVEIAHLRVLRFSLPVAELEVHFRLFASRSFRLGLDDSVL
jgi:hypothetical protein